MNVPLCSNSVLSPNQITSIDVFERKGKSEHSKNNADNFCMLSIFNVAPVHWLPKNTESFSYFRSYSGVNLNEIWIS